MIIRARVLTRVTILAAIASLPTLWAASASAVPLSNGLDVNCNPPGGNGVVVCTVGGCPRVHGDYVVDAMHFRIDYGEQSEREFKCINGATSQLAITPDKVPPGATLMISVQGCRKKTLEGDWCGPWADYKYKVPADAAPVAPPPPPPAPAPAPPPAPAPAANTITADVDVYDVPGGAGKVVGMARSGTKVKVEVRNDDNWVKVSGSGVPGGSGWIWGDFVS
jgi:hypothetical protein